MSFPTVLITGARGFAGRYIAQQIKSSGYNVVGLVQDMTQDVNTVSANILDLKSLEHAIEHVQPEYIIHLAAIAFVAHGDISSMYQTNIVGTHNVLQAAYHKAKHLKKIIVTSSANVYGNASVQLLTEDTPIQPANDYAVSKAAMEMMASLWMTRLPMIVVRPFNFTGVGQSIQFLVPKIVSHFKNKAEYIELGNTNVERDFSDVRVVAEVYQKLLESAEVSQTFNICSGTVYTIQSILEMMTEIARHTVEVRMNPELVRNNEVKTLRGSKEHLEHVIGHLQYPLFFDTLRWMYNE